MPSTGNSDPNSIQRLTCPRCLGDGYFVDQREQALACENCRGAGVIETFGARALIWGLRLDRSEVSRRRLRRTLNLVINSLLMAFGLVGIGLGFYELYQIINRGGALAEFWATTNPSLLVFWLSLFTDSYVYYRLDREHKPRRIITRQAEIGPAAPLEKSFADWLADPGSLEDVSELLDGETSKLLESARQLADRLNHKEIWPTHVLAALLSSPTAALIFVRLGLDRRQLQAKITHLFSGFSRDTRGEPRLSKTTKELFMAAYREAYQERQPQIGVPELVIALGTTEADSQALLDDLEVTETKLRHVVAWIRISRQLREQYKRFRHQAARRSKHGMNRALTATATPVLDRFSHDLTELAQRGALPLSVGRQTEINEIFRALESRHNPILVGPPGVGKTAIIDGLAQRMASDDVPEVLKDKRLVSISVAALVSNAAAPGELEGRFSRLLNEVAHSGNIVLFFDNIHNLIGVSSAGGQTLDLAGLLAQALEAGVCQALATSNPVDYRRYLENTSSITSVFSRVDVDEVETDEAILVLESKAGGIEYKHKVFFTYDAIERTVQLSQRYIHDRYLPEKAISLLEEVAVDTHKRRGSHASVTGEDVARVVSEKTHVQVTKITEAEGERLINLESQMHQRMIGQDEAVKAVASALRRARTELRDAKRPIANLLFLGPTGVGKTELAKTVAEAYFGSEQTMIRLDMSEYQDASSIHRLIGAPPGYAGGNVGGYLTEAIRQNPFSLVLLDELEKAHSEVLNVFLQVMDDGRLTDGTGRTVDFTSAIIIATSNAGTSLIQKRILEGAPLDRIKTELISAVLGQYFKPEFLNRFDEVIVFKPLTREEIFEIVRLMLGRIGHQLKDRGISFVASEEAMRELAEIGFDPIFGARPLRRVIQERVDNALANYLLQGRLGRRDVAILEPGGTVRVERAEPI